MKSRSLSEAINGSGQGASWQICVWNFICQEALVFKKRAKCRLNIVDTDNKDANASDAIRKYSLCHSCLPKQLQQKSSPIWNKIEYQTYAFRDNSLKTVMQMCLGIQINTNGQSKAFMHWNITIISCLAKQFLHPTNILQVYCNKAASFSSTRLLITSAPFFKTPTFHYDWRVLEECLKSYLLGLWSLQR